MTNANIRIARFSDNYKYIIDSKGKKVKLDDPRVTHIWAIDTNDYISRMITNVFRRRGWNARITGQTTNEVMRYAKNLVSGRECLPCVSMAGATYRDIVEKRPPNEVSVYYNLDQEGPCQNGAWPLVWETFAKRIGKENIVYCANPNIRNNFIGEGESFATEMMASIILGDLLEEAEMALKVLAKDRGSAMKEFSAHTDEVVESMKRGVFASGRSLKKWAGEIAKIPLKGDINKTPKVLLFGGLNVSFVHYPVSKYFLEQGVIPKIVDFAEGVTWIESEPVPRYGLKRGILDPKKQYKMSSILMSLFNPLEGFKPKNKFKEGLRAARARAHIAGVDFLQKRFRKIAEKSGLLFEKHLSFLEILFEGHKYISANGFCETPINTGRFLVAVKAGVYDGYVNLGTFNCQPAMNTQAVLRTIANKYEVPYASIDCEGPNISANQRRLLETIAVQAKRQGSALHPNSRLL